MKQEEIIVELKKIEEKAESLRLGYGRHSYPPESLIDIIRLIKEAIRKLEVGGSS
jgi:hypothetical protein